MTSSQNRDLKKASSFSANASVTQWIAGLKAGKAEAADRLWHRYFERLVRLAQRKLGSAPRRVADEEDVAAIVFHNLWQGGESGRFPDLRNRDNLWPLLIVLTSRRVVDLFRREKRYGGAAAAEEDLDNLIAQEPSPEYAATLTEKQSRGCLPPSRAPIAADRAPASAGQEKRRDRPRAGLQPADGRAEAAAHPPDLGREPLSLQVNREPGLRQPCCHRSYRRTRVHFR